MRAQIKAHDTNRTRTASPTTDPNRTYQLGESTARSSYARVLDMTTLLYPASSFRTIRVPSTNDLSLREQSQRGSWKNPQSGVSQSLSAGTYWRIDRIRSATSWGVSA